LIAAAAGRSAGTRIAGVVVARPASELRPAIESMVRALVEIVATDPDPARDADVVIDLDESQLGDGYGRPTVAAAEATRLLARTQGILTDPIYTAKALAGLVAAVRTGAWDGRRIVFWHAGGLPGIFEPLD
jgi:1-aminocyclopropane-1-carboxylate deaminase/D-cysteine desulfhydrase-like pyridoxal-dependent ACC family enzyme